jgi:hypothetical protein
MFQTDRNCKRLFVQISVVATGVIIFAVAAQGNENSPSEASPVATGISRMQSNRGSLFLSMENGQDGRVQDRESATRYLAEGSSSIEEEPGSDGVRRVTLQQVKQSADRAVSAYSRLSQLQVEVAKQHRLAAQADYFPKFGATFMNLHTTDFLGQLIAGRRRSTVRC